MYNLSPWLLFIPISLLCVPYPLCVFPCVAQRWIPLLAKYVLVFSFSPSTVDLKSHTIHLFIWFLPALFRDPQIPSFFVGRLLSFGSTHAFLLVCSVFNFLYAFGLLSTALTILHCTLLKPQPSVRHTCYFTGEYFTCDCMHTLTRIVPVFKPVTTVEHAHMWVE